MACGLHSAQVLVVRDYLEWRLVSARAATQGKRRAGRHDGGSGGDWPIIGPGYEAVAATFVGSRSKVMLPLPCRRP